MAGPVMLRTKTDIAIFIPALVVVAQGIAASLGRRLVEPYLREYPPNGLNAHHRRALALVLDRRQREVRVAEMILVPLVGDVVLVHPVVGQLGLYCLVTILAQP